MRHNSRQQKEPNTKTFLEHFYELRSRLLTTVAFFLAASVAGYFIREHILGILFRLYPQPLFYTTPTAGIDLALKVSIGIGFCLSVPLAVYEIFQFLKPALPKSFHRKAALVVGVATILLAVGITFAYFITLPAALHFLGRFRVKDVSYFVSADSYVSFVIRYILVFGLVFELPLLLVTASILTPLTYKRLLRFQGWVIILSFLIAAILTPTPDPGNQLMMALPLIGLYEVSVVVIYLMHRKRGYFLR